MGKHFIAILGTSLYEPVIYCTGDFKSKQEYVQLALIEKYKKELSEEGSAITIFVTESSEKRNYIDREYSEADVNASSRWKTSGKESVVAGNVKKGLYTQFTEQFPELRSKFEYVTIADARNEDEMWDIFENIYSKINENDEIIFDITHGFRSIPMLALTVVNYAKTLKNCSLLNMSYGMFEAGELHENGEKYVPIADLTIYNEILEWTEAANVFMKYGNAGMMTGLLSDKLKKAPVPEKRYWNEIKTSVEAASRLSDTILTCRGIDGKKTKFDVTKQSYISIKNAYERFAQKNTDDINQKITNVKPLYPLFEKAKENFSIFDKEENYQVGLAVVEWSIKNGMIQQGYTALEESIKTFLCWYYGVDEISQRDAIVGACGIALNKGHVERVSLETESDRLSYFEKLKADNFFKCDESDMETVKKIIMTFPLELADIMNTIKKERNDINHFGIRLEPMNCNVFAENLKKHYTTVKQIVEKMEGEKRES